MRAFLAVLALCVACSSGDDDEEDDDITGPPPVPACGSHPLATSECRDAGFVTADGKVTGIRCDTDGPDDGSWPEGCEELDINPAQVTYCCPW